MDRLNDPARVIEDLRRYTTLRQTPARRALLARLAEADGQDLDSFDLGHTAEAMYGREADAIEAQP